MNKRIFSKPVLAMIHNSKIMGVRSGTQHRFTGIWVVVVKERVFVRSWENKPTGWHHAFLKDSTGAIQVSGREIAVRAKRVRGERLMEAIEEAYAEKYNTKASLKYVRGFRLEQRRMTTMEFVPV
ncbi:DUF2255 family protein [bacterium]|nr:DUF2255 family protein [bacterium]